MSLAEGTVLGGRFAIVRPLGGGGWGEVYEARQLDLERRVAIKILRAGTEAVPEALARFEREARSAAALGHPNIVQITHFENAPDAAPFLVMELFAGVTLTRLVPLERARAIPIFAQILSALDAAHGAGIVHRDIKPANVMVIPLAGGADLVKVLDFGIARLDAGAKLTATGTFVGTPRYMPPEQVLGREIDARADLYSVGATLYHALTGKTSIGGSDATAILEAVVRGDHTPITTLSPGIDPALAAIVDRALAIDPAARFASAKHMLAALLDVPAPAPSLAPPVPSTARTIATILAIGIVIAAIGVAAVGALFVRGHAAPTPHPEPATVATPPPPSASVEPLPVEDAAPPIASSSTAIRAVPLTRRFIRGSSARGMGSIGTTPNGAASIIEHRPLIEACLAKFQCPGRERIYATYLLHVDNGVVKSLERSAGSPCPALDRCLRSTLAALTFDVNPDLPRGTLEADYTFDPTEP